MRGIFQLKSCHQQLKITITTQSHKFIKSRFLSTIPNQTIQLTSDFKLIHLLKDIKTSINSTQTEHENEKKIINSLDRSIQDLKDFKERRVKRLGIYGDQISGRDQLINCLLCDPLNESYHQSTDQLLNSRNLHQSGLIRIRYGSIAKWNEDNSILEIPNQWLKDNNLEIIEDERFQSVEQNDLHLLIIDEIRKEIQPQMFFKLLHFNTFLIGINQIGYQRPEDQMILSLPQSLIPLNRPKPFEINTFRTLNSFKTLKSNKEEDFDPSGFYKLREAINTTSSISNQKLQTSISIGRLSLSTLSQSLLKLKENLIELENLIIEHEEKIKKIKIELNQTILKLDKTLIGINQNQIKEFFQTKLQWWKVLIFSIDLGEVIRNFNQTEDLKLKLLLSYQSGQLSIYSKTLQNLTLQTIQSKCALIPSTLKHDLLIDLNRSLNQSNHHTQKDLNLERLISMIKKEYTKLYVKFSTISIGFGTVLGFSLYGNWIEMENFLSFWGVFLGICWIRIESNWKRRVLNRGLKDWNRARDLVLTELQENESNLIEKELFKVNEKLSFKFKEVLKVYQDQNSLEQSNLKEFIQRLNQLENEIQNRDIK